MTDYEEGTPVVETAKEELLQHDEEMDDEKEHMMDSPKSFRGFRGMNKEEDGRRDHLQMLVVQRRASTRALKEMMGSGVSDASALRTISLQYQQLPSYRLTDEEREKIENESRVIKETSRISKELQAHFPVRNASLEVRVNNFSYKVKLDEKATGIRTIYNQTRVHDVWLWMKRIYRGEKRPEPKEVVVLDRIDLVFKPGRMYLVLGDPGRGGKEALLKAIAGRLEESKDRVCEGSILYNEVDLREHKKLISSSQRKKLHIENAIVFVDKIDFHAPRLTVKETFDFAFQCRAGGTHIHLPPGTRIAPEAKTLLSRFDKEKVRTKLNLDLLGLTHVADTFVGNSEIRGVSGGQRRRVSAGEMSQSLTPVFVGDEISTGLDAASTYDICRALMYFGNIQRNVRILSLLQPSPETVSLFDEVILMAEGKILFAGPISEVENYFSGLGYRSPNEMDVADFLQEISTADGTALYQNDLDMNGNGKPYTMSGLADQFRLSAFYTRITDAQELPWKISWDETKDGVDAYGTTYKRYQNSFPRSVYLNLVRNIVLWSRDKRFLIANAIKNVIMGVSVGGIFYNTTAFISFFGVTFQTCLFIMLGAMTSAPSLIDDRIIFYKHNRSNFYGAAPYVLAKSFALLPQSLIDVSIFGTIIYFMVGFVRSASNFFIYLMVLFVFSLAMNSTFSIFTSIAKSKTAVQAMSACVLLFLILFSGFIVNPDVIPSYWIWVYWWNPLAWTYRAILVNEFRSQEYDIQFGESGKTEGELILESQGLVEPGGEAFGREWIGYNFAYQLGYLLFCLILTTLGLTFVRADGDDFGFGTSRDSVDSKVAEEEKTVEDIVLAITPVTLTFKGVNYDVNASTGKEKLRLLNDVNGIFEAKKMIALMGSSGAGKTTLMDVIAMRKTSGTVTGDIRVNGFLQERDTFRRFTGYVEQFDVQSPELTVRETVLFSARMRLGSTQDIVATEEGKVRYVDWVLRKLDLTVIQHFLVGNDEEGGLSFEQRKRLSVAVEMAASPSLIFLDEPTSGLDSKAALTVMKAMRELADTGRTVVATIHQPSLNIFEMFDELLLLKKGGRTVFFGELGQCCKGLVDYFKSLGAPPIEVGENPANWMLKVITAEDAPCDYAEAFNESELHKRMMQRIDSFNENPNPRNKIEFSTKFATTLRKRQGLINERFRTIYFRSPAYNLSRLAISILIAFILGSVFLNNRHPDVFSETDISSLFATVFISFIIMGVLSIISVLPVMLKLRDSFYKFRLSGMVGSNSVALALGVAEKWFIVVSSAFFCLLFISTAGLNFLQFKRVVSFWGFFTFNLALYSYFGQAFMCLVRGMGTAMILASVFIGINNFFSGLIVRPQYIVGFFVVPYYITPGHYVYEGLMVSLFDGDNRTVVANQGSDFYDYLDCSQDGVDPCQGTVDQYFNVFFGGKYNRGNISLDIGVLTAFLILARLATFLALKYFNYTSS